MKNLKKIIALFVFAVAALIITSCGGGVKSYNVTYFVEDANGVDSVFATEKVEDGKMASKPRNIPTKNGYDFKYWTASNSTIEYDWNKPVSSNLELHAYFSRTYQVVFSGNGHGTIEGNRIYTRSNISYVPNIVPDAESTLFTFKGWYKDAACTDGNKVEANSELTENLNLYAKWETAKISYTSLDVFTSYRNDVKDAADFIKEGQAHPGDNTLLADKQICPEIKFIADNTLKLKVMADDPTDPTNTIEFGKNGKGGVAIKTEFSAKLSFKFISTGSNPTRMSLYEGTNVQAGYSVAKMDEKNAAAKVTLQSTNKDDVKTIEYNLVAGTTYYINCDCSERGARLYSIEIVAN